MDEKPGELLKSDGKAEKVNEKLSPKYKKRDMLQAHPL